MHALAPVVALCLGSVVLLDATYTDPPPAVVEATTETHAAAPAPAVDGRATLPDPRVPSPSTTGLPRTSARWQWPITPRPAVLRPFVRPSSQWGAGHRGVDLAGRAGTLVRAVAAGTVTHVGTIAGRPTLTVTHPDGLRSTYEPVRASVHQGDLVDAGDALGVLVPEGSHCLPVTCLHLGALRGPAYLDPLRLLEDVRVRLLPLWR